MLALVDREGSQGMQETSSDCSGQWPKTTIKQVNCRENRATVATTGLLEDRGYKYQCCRGTEIQGKRFNQHQKVDRLIKLKL